MRRGQAGLTTVEFAIVGGLALTVLFGSIEMGRMLYTWNTVAEATRRAARIAAVCPTDGVAARQAALFDSSGTATESRFIHGLTPDNVIVSYLGADGAPNGEFAKIRYVRVAITDYQHRLIVPFLGRMVPVPPFETTVPSESLGLIPGSEPGCPMG